MWNVTWVSCTRLPKHIVNPCDESSLNIWASCSNRKFWICCQYQWYYLWHISWSPMELKAVFMIRNVVLITATCVSWWDPLSAPWLIMCSFCLMFAMLLSGDNANWMFPFIISLFNPWTFSYSLNSNSYYCRYLANDHCPYILFNSSKLNAFLLPGTVQNAHLMSKKIDWISVYIRYT